MPYTPEERRQIELQMFGMTREQLVSEKPKFYKPSMYAMSILSDVQELLARKPDSRQLERARQWINKAKFWIDVCDRGPDVLQE